MSWQRPWRGTHKPTGTPRERKAFDLAVVGGGALGCAVAWEAATRGIRVVLLEQDDFGSGASANSLKLVHGGLRYLQKLDLVRARASVAERSTFLRVAPHLVRPLACVMPTQEYFKRGRLAMAAGLAVNAAVTIDRNHSLRSDRRLAAGGLIGLATLAKLAPGLNLEGATGGVRWFDAQMLDSERLALAFALGAESEGATILNHHQVIRWVIRGGHIGGVAVVAKTQAREFEIAARNVVDCRSGWVGLDSTLAAPAGAPRFIRAINLVLPDAGLKCAVGFPQRDEDGEVIPGRMLFATPWNSVTLVGTWYLPDAAGGPVDAAALGQMLACANRSFGGWRFTLDQVRMVHQGLIPAAPDSPESQLVEAGHGGLEPVPAERPVCLRADADGGPAGLWFLQTEKWTTVRRLAEDFVDRVAAEGGVNATPSVSSALALPGGESWRMGAAERAVSKSGLPLAVAMRLLVIYGARAGVFLEFANTIPGGLREIPGSGGVLAAEVSHAIQREHAKTLADVMRRTGIGAADRPSRQTLRIVAELAAGLLGWSPPEQYRQVNEILASARYLPQQRRAKPAHEAVQREQRV